MSTTAVGARSDSPLGGYDSDEDSGAHIPAGPKANAGTYVGAGGTFGGWVDKRAPSSVAGARVNAGSTDVGPGGTFGGGPQVPVVSYIYCDSNGVYQTCSHADPFAGAVAAQQAAQRASALHASETFGGDHPWGNPSVQVSDSAAYRSLDPARVQSGCGQNRLVQVIYKFFIAAPKYLCVAIGWTAGLVFGTFLGAGAGAATGAVVGSTISVALELFFGKYCGLDQTLQDQEVSAILKDRCKEAAIFTVGCFVAGISCHFLASHFLSAIGVSSPTASFSAQTLSNVFTYTGTATVLRGACVYSHDEEARKQWKKNLLNDFGTGSLLIGPLKVFKFF